MTAEFWLGIQAHYDLEIAQQSAGRDIAAIKPRKTA
jgi:plasmid maintenance system antidote protein VapI